MLKTSNTQDMVSNRFIIGIVAFGVSFGLTLVFTWWNFSSALGTGIITILATYTATFIVDKRAEKRRKNHELQVIDSYYKRIQELESLHHGITIEVNQLEAHRRALHTESNQLQHQVGDRRNQRDSLNRELSTFALQKKQLESEVIHLQNEIKDIDKSKEEASNSFASIAAEKRRLELNCNVSKAEITQLHAKIGELLQEQEELENNLTLLNRLKPQLEEKLYELRVQLQELEAEEKKQKELFNSRNNKLEKLESNLKLLKTQRAEEKKQLEQLQGQTSLLEAERDVLQNQVWELLQQLENQNPQFVQPEIEEATEEFPFEELIETITIDPEAEKEEAAVEELIETITIETAPITQNTSSELPTDWTDFWQSLSQHEIQVIKAIFKQKKVNSAIKKIAEENITMPNLLIDSINERAQNTIGELIIATGNDIPEIDREYKDNIEKLIAISEEVKSKQASSK